MRQRQRLGLFLLCGCGVAKLTLQASQPNIRYKGRSFFAPARAIQIFLEHCGCQCRFALVVDQHAGWS